MTTYTHKYVNGVLIALNSGDQTALAARDAQDWETNLGGAVVLTAGSAAKGSTPADKMARLLNAHGLSLGEFKAALGI